MDNRFRASAVRTGRRKNTRLLSCRSRGFPMRIVVTLAALLALPFAVFAGEDSTGADAPALASSSPASSESDTSVYHLEHARANQLIGRVKSLIKQIASCTNDEDVADLPASLVLLPTTSDDSIVAICPRAHAALVKH